MEKPKDEKESYSYSELNEIRAKSIDTIRKIRDEILSQNINDSDNTFKVKHLRTSKKTFLDSLGFSNEGS